MWDISAFGSVDLLLKSTRRHKKRSCFSGGGGDEVNVRQFQIPTSAESRVDYASLRSGATRSSGSVVALGLGWLFWPWIPHSGSPERGCGVHGASSLVLSFVSNSRQ